MLRPRTAERHRGAMDGGRGDSRGTLDGENHGQLWWTPLVAVVPAAATGACPGSSRDARRRT
ncbi:hypothetical protein [Streptomyces litmocidini]|uniref:hypothetical protein n=1 Tax=Streptomyces litmocidini TaxID=67318 RepID=UPI0037034792